MPVASVEKKILGHENISLYGMLYALKLEANQYSVVGNVPMHSFLSYVVLSLPHGYEASFNSSRLFVLLASCKNS